MIEIYVGGDPSEVEKFDPITDFDGAVKWLKGKYDGDGLTVIIRDDKAAHEFLTPFEEWVIFEFDFIRAIKEATGLGFGEYLIRISGFNEDPLEGGFLEYSQDGKIVKFACGDPYIRIYKPGEKDPTGILVDGYLTPKQLIAIHGIHDWITDERKPFDL